MLYQPTDTDKSTELEPKTVMAGGETDESAELYNMTLLSERPEL
jgi:hypothetical protein